MLDLTAGPGPGASVPKLPPFLQPGTEMRCPALRVPAAPN
jgi:hypothetical protein